MNLNEESWKEFRLGDLFEIKKGKRLTSEDQTEGTTPYIGAIDSNNGVANKIGQDPIHSGNTISLSYNGSVGEAFYQPVPFWATDDVNVLYFKETNGVAFNLYIALFICSVLKAEKYRFSYGRKWTLENMNNTIIKLPATEDNNPNWIFMEQYIKSLNHKPLSTTNQGGYGSHTLGVETWKEYRLGDLFSKMYKAEAHVKGDLECYDSPCGNTIRFISRTEMNNGCDCYVNNNEITGIEKGNAIAIGDTTATCSYQAKEFVCGDHMVICRAPWINPYSALFIISILKREKYKFSYGRAFKMELISNTFMKLPSSKDGRPDWSFMENYIKSLPYGDRI